MNVPRISEFHADHLYQHALKDPRIKLYLPDPAPESTRRPCGRRFLFDVSLARSLQCLLPDR